MVPRVETPTLAPLLSRLLREPPAPIPAADVRAWWDAVRAAGTVPGEPIDQAVADGGRADRVGFAFAAGYQAALRALLRPAGHRLADGAVASFCATETGGNHPRAIQSRLTPGPGGARLSGAKRWSTMAPVADVLLVVASEGADDAGRNRLRLVRVEARAPGVRIAAMPPTPFVPEVPHGEIALTGVAVGESAVLPGDGYARYVKPFRTVEDLHIHGALLGYLLAVGRRHAFPREALERLAAAVVAVHGLAALDPAAPEVHVALAGLLAQDARLVDDLGEAWAGVEAPERERWQRDRALLGAVAGQVRERRRQRAWEILTAG
jgi:alkylation response protein AidB-like acyl-CoA dehydrogenase